MTRQTTFLVNIFAFSRLGGIYTEEQVYIPPSGLSASGHEFMCCLGFIVTLQEMKKDGKVELRVMVGRKGYY